MRTRIATIVCSLLLITATATLSPAEQPTTAPTTSPVRILVIDKDSENDQIASKASSALPKDRGFTFEALRPEKAKEYRKDLTQASSAGYGRVLIVSVSYADHDSYGAKTTRSVITLEVLDPAKDVILSSHTFKGIGFSNAGALEDGLDTFSKKFETGVLE